MQRKFRKIARTCRQLHRNLCRDLPAGRAFLLDEEETFEKASIRPLTMSVIIEKESYLIVATAVGPIRRLAAEGTGRRRRQDRDEARRGRRRDRSRVCVRATMRALQRRIGSGPLTLLSDEKASYRTLAIDTFGGAVRHETTSSRVVRNELNPLFPINLTLAMTRDNCGRLTRDSWLVTEKRRCLQLQMHLFTAYRNYVRARKNEDVADDTPARILGLLPRALEAREVLAWRQDWGPLSIHPTCRNGARRVA